MKKILFILLLAPMSAFSGDYTAWSCPKSLSLDTPGAYWLPMDPWIKMDEYQITAPVDMDSYETMVGTEVLVEGDHPWQAYYRGPLSGVRSGDMVRYSVDYHLDDVSKPVWLELLDLSKGPNVVEAAVGAVRLQATPGREGKRCTAAVTIPATDQTWGLRIRGEGHAVLSLGRAELDLWVPASWKNSTPLKLRVGPLSLEVDNESFTLQREGGQPWRFVWPEDKTQWRMTTHGTVTGIDSEIEMRGIDSNGVPVTRRLQFDIWKKALKVDSDEGATLRLPSPQVQSGDQWILPLDQGMVLEQADLERIWNSEASSRAVQLGSMTWAAVRRGNENLYIRPERKISRDASAPSLVWRGQKQAHGFGIDWHRAGQSPYTPPLLLSLNTDPIAAIEKKYDRDLSY